MEATFETHRLDRLAATPGYAGGYLLERLGDGRHSAIAFWSVPAERPDRFEVQVDADGAAAGRTGQALAVNYFDGPLSPARLAAGRFGYEARIAPALAAVPGLVRSLQLWQPVSAALCVVTVAVDLDALEDVGRAVNSTELLPGEDPALLTGPDRFEIHRVLSATPTGSPVHTEGAQA